MKVFLCFPLADGQTGPAIKHAFENLGHEVLAIDARLQTQEIYKRYCEFKGDLVFCAKAPEITEQIRLIKQRFNPIICIWNMDTRTDINYWAFLFPLIKLCNYNFVPDTGTILEWKKINKNTFWLPQGLQDEIYKKPKNITDADRLKYTCDVCFAGDLGIVHELRLPYFEAIDRMGINFNVWGCRGKPRIYNEEHNKMVALSKINIGCSCWPENGKYTSVRNYKIMGAGGFLLELYRDGFYDFFPQGGTDTYRDKTALTELIIFWLDNENERKKVAENGYKWVHENATYTDRIRMALRYMGLK